MAEFGWAFVSGAVTGKGGADSVQFIKTTNGELTGSSNFRFNHSSNNLFLTGTMIISGTLQAHTFDIIHTNKIELSSSGASNFGDDHTDTHAFTGSVIMVSGALTQYYRKITTATHTVQPYDSILGISSSGYVSIELPGASGQGAGRILTIKDEFQITRTQAGNTHIAITASGGDKIDHQTSYVIEGDSVALTLYSDGGTNWFIY
jgi:hypothetical protein